jgi:hypothetical protein
MNVVDFRGQGFLLEMRISNIEQGISNHEVALDAPDLPVLSMSVGSKSRLASSTSTFEIPCSIFDIRSFGRGGKDHEA